jgi:hypothetical protein
MQILVAFNSFNVTSFNTPNGRIRETGSSVSTVSDYGQDDRAIEVRSPAETKDFSSNLCVQTGSGAHPASCTVGTRGSFPEDKTRPGRDADHSPPSSDEVVGAISPLLPSASIMCSGTTLSFTF